MTLEQSKKLISWARKHGIARLKVTGLEVEFFKQDPEPMKLDPKSLADALSDTMPPDSQMLFASSEDLPDDEINEESVQ